jgi:hypothetical protein
MDKGELLEEDERVESLSIRDVRSLAVHESREAFSFSTRNLKHGLSIAESESFAIDRPRGTTRSNAIARIVLCGRRGASQKIRVELALDRPAPRKQT